MEDTENFLKTIDIFAKQIKELNQMACEAYRPITEKLCTGIASKEEVESALDEMLAFCGSNEMLVMFKQICRCYYKKYPDMIAFEINEYREMWDYEEESYYSD